jgi:hypothetical protein
LPVNGESQHLWDDVVARYRDQPLSVFLKAAQKNPTWPKQALADYFAALPSAQRKCPNWVEAGCRFEKQAIEQASSEATAKAKRRWLGPAARVFDCTAGLGIDSWIWATDGADWFANDMNQPRATLLRDNAIKLGLSVELSHDDGSAWLHNLCSLDLDKHDLVLCDPDRRVGGQRHSTSESWSPDPASWLATLRQAHPAVKWLLKLGTAVDPHHWLDDYPEASVLILGWRGECREVLLTQADHLPTGVVTAWIIDDSGKATLELSSALPAAEPHCDALELCEQAHQVWVAPSTIRKARLGPQWCHHFGLHPVDEEATVGLALKNDPATRSADHDHNASNANAAQHPSPHGGTVVFAATGVKPFRTWCKQNRLLSFVSRGRHLGVDSSQVLRKNKTSSEVPVHGLAVQYGHKSVYFGFTNSIPS